MPEGAAPFAHPDSAESRASSGTPAHASAVARLQEALVSARNTDGGWGYYRDRQSRLEPTCWALLALAASGRLGFEPDVLHRWVDRRGLLLDLERGPANHASNALAALMLLDTPGGAGLARAVLAALVEARGVALGQRSDVRQDNSIRAWAWIDSTFSWVEPTAWSVLALKKWTAGGPAPAVGARIRDGERLLVDRACAAGGWNVGSARVLEQDLHPYVPTTALGLLALQDRRDSPVVTAAEGYLSQHATAEPSTMAMSLVAICFRVYGRASEEVERRLLQQTSVTVSRGHIMGIAMGLYALTGSQHEMAAFRL